MAQPVSGRAGGPGNTQIAAATPPPSQPFYPGGWKAAGQDLGGVLGGAAAGAAATALLPEEATVAGVAGVARMLPWGYRALRAALTVGGAGAGGGAVAAAEGAPITGAEGEDSIAHAAKTQSEQEAAGLGVGWLAGGIGRRLIASRVAQNAKDWLEATRNLNMEDVKGVLQRAQDAIRAHATTGAVTKAAQTTALAPLEAESLAHQMAAKGMESAAKTNTAAAQRSAAMIPEARVAGKAEADQLKAQWPTAEGPPMALGHTPGGSAASPPPNYPAQATRAVTDVVEGPAQTSLDRLGKAVENSAQSGPRLNLTGLKAKMQTMFAKTQPMAEEAAIPAEIQAQFSGSRKSPEQIRQMLTDAGIPLEAEHPLPGVLGKIQDLPNDVEFATGHQTKRMLDDAIGWKPPGAVKAPARTQLAQITKGIRGELRDQMAVHEPYNQATAAYRDASKLFGPQGLPRKIQAAANANPEAIVNSLVKPSEPTKFQMLKEVLTTHAEAGGGEEGKAAGQAAWQRVQSTVMYKHLIQPGIENFDASVAKMHPEFLHTLTSDPEARQVFDRLQQMSEAVKTSEGQTAQTIRDLGAQSRSARASARDLTTQAAKARTGQAISEASASMIRQQGKQVAAQHAVEGQQLQTDRLEAQRAVSDAAQPTAAERAFDKSSLVKQGNAVQQGSDLAYAAVSPPGSARQVAGVARLALRGPKMNDLIRWASLSPTGTQMFVRAVTSPVPGQGIAAMIRLYDWMHGAKPPEMAVGHKQGGTTAGPAGSAATPPPGPR
jgi:hypothetical protein